MSYQFNNVCFFCRNKQFIYCLECHINFAEENNILYSSSFELFSKLSSCMNQSISLQNINRVIKKDDSCFLKYISEIPDFLKIVNNQETINNLLSTIISFLSRKCLIFLITEFQIYSSISIYEEYCNRFYQEIYPTKEMKGELMKKISMNKNNNIERVTFFVKFCMN